MTRALKIGLMYWCSLLIAGCDKPVEPDKVDGSSSTSAETNRTPETTERPTPLSAMSVAIANGDLTEVKAILDKNPDAANASPNASIPPLSMAILRQKTAIAKLLVEQGANIGETALAIANANENEAAIGQLKDASP